MKKEEALSLAKLRYIDKSKIKKDFEELKNYLKKHNLIKERK
ncbi:hypothetical protein [Lebetimonas sp. JS138]|nr:hypothetical protein [Lebetimonas sp. JS138]